nr:MAG TPA: hypothetical protein [Caudoviricetes sp.]
MTSGFYSFLHGYGHGHGRADHGVVAHALFAFFRLPTFCQNYPVAIVPQGFSRMVVS